MSHASSQFHLLCIHCLEGGIACCAGHGAAHAHGAGGAHVLEFAHCGIWTRNSAHQASFSCLRKHLSYNILVLHGLLHGFHSSAFCGASQVVFARDASLFEHLRVLIWILGSELLLVLRIGLPWALEAELTTGASESSESDGQGLLEVLLLLYFLMELLLKAAGCLLDDDFFHFLISDSFIVIIGLSMVDDFVKGSELAIWTLAFVIKFLF